MINILAIFLGGGIGSIFRYGISRFCSKYVTLFPLGTFVANVISCILLALAVIYFSQKSDNTTLKLLIITGFCGGFSTFSTFSIETAELIKQGYFYIALFNIVLSVVVGISLIYFITKNHIQ